ncbi:glycine-rich domain-containing protein [Gluconobacter sphaericus]|uniref:glycine-rich domain-containing protein n=1 Tax=Gluconobacter sphaericus TaxID=574987 RepID=UPI00312B86EA
MDRAIVYAGSIPLDTDLLQAGRYTKAAFGNLASMLYGPNVMAASGLGYSASSSDLSLTVEAGSILAPGVIDATSLGGNGGGLSADTTALTCQYISTESQIVTLPGSGNTYTVYAVCSEQDVDPTVLPFFNASNPSQTQAGIQNDGGALPVRRAGVLSLVAAANPPSAPSGGCVVALYTIAVPQGASSLSGVTVQPGQVFWPTIPELATQALLKACTEPMTLVTVNGSVPVPAWASRVELRVIGGGGGGAASQSMTTAGAFSGAGGGGGGDAWGIYAVSPTQGNGLAITVGSGGGSEQTGGTSLVSYNGQTLLQAEGGQGGAFYSTIGSAGGVGGNASGGTIWNQSGTSGGDGQCNAYTFSGYGGDGPWGGAGRCGNQGGRLATRYGAGGGGSYSATAEGVSSNGGAGYQGCALYRFLP